MNSQQAMTRYFLSITILIIVLAMNSFAQEGINSAKSAWDTVTAQNNEISINEKLNPKLYCSTSFGIDRARMKCSGFNNNQPYQSYCFLYDMRLGLALTNKVALFLDYISTNPIIMDENNTSSTSVSEQMYGGGFTYYFMPKNIFISCAAGMGKITQYRDNDKKVSFSSNSGLSFQLKAGFERMISKHFAVGIVCSFLKSSITSETNDSRDEWNNTHLSLGAIITYKL